MSISCLFSTATTVASSSGPAPSQAQALTVFPRLDMNYLLQSRLPIQLETDWLPHPGLASVAPVGTSALVCRECYTQEPRRIRLLRTMLPQQPAQPLWHYEGEVPACFLYVL